MLWSIHQPVSPASIEEMRAERNITGLIRILGNEDPGLGRLAAETLASMGPDAAGPLLSVLDSRSIRVRISAAGALGTMKTREAIPRLSRILQLDTTPEARWAAAIALGAIGSEEAVPSLVAALQDKDRYVRMWSGHSLGSLGWEPAGEYDCVLYLIALQDWDGVKTHGTGAAGPLRDSAEKIDPNTREKILGLLSGLGDQSSASIIMDCIRDRDPRLRWTAVSTAMNCGVRPGCVPGLYADRERTGPNPAAAALLNFLFLGIGYNYIGKWWGFPVFMSYMTIVVIAQLMVGPLLPYLFAYPVTGIFAVQTYYAAKRMADY